MMPHRFARTELLIGKQGLAVLAASKVAVFGIGGVGSFAAEALARSGIGSLTMVDFDRVDVTNINRQLHALSSTVGLYKVDVMEARIRDINPDCRVEISREFFQPEREGEFLNEDFDYVIDAIDSVRSKVGLISGCVSRGIPIISVMGAGRKLDPAAFQVVDISETYNDPLARVVRKGLRDLGITKGVKVVFSPELPQRPPEGVGDDEGKGSPNRQPPGSIAFVPPVAGLIAASVVVRDLLERGSCL
jgi:tRNA A37 threonylcarbamoyladenosine dehydratase